MRAGVQPGFTRITFLILNNRLNKAILAFSILLLATALWLRQQRSLHANKAALAETKRALAALSDRLATGTDELEAARRELRGLKASRKSTESAIAAAEQELAKSDPERRWTSPPASLPDWNAESPYLWLRKEMLPKLPVEVFTQNGELQPEAAHVLTLTSDQENRLNSTLARLLAEYRSLEATNAKISDEHLPGVAGENGEKLTVRVQPLPEDGARLKQEFETALRTELGAQRADLLIQTGEGWLDSQFSQFGAEPKTISLIRHAHDNYNLSIQSGGSTWLSMSGPWRIVGERIPSHLRSLFNPLAGSDTE